MQLVSKWVGIYTGTMLTTDDAFWSRLTLAACYQLAQSVLKIGSVLAERVDEGRWVGEPLWGDSAWRLLQRL